MTWKMEWQSAVQRAVLSRIVEGIEIECRPAG
jgi:hypothetical protein